MDWKRMRAPVLACVTLAFAAGTAAAEVNACNEPPPPGYNLIDERAGIIEGTPRNDYIVGSAEDDVITAGYGRDIVCAGDGNDVVYGGGSSDDLHGGNGYDKLFGELLDDELYGGPNRDVLLGGHGTDKMYGQEGNDWLRGGTNNDLYNGGTNERDNDVASFADTPTIGSKITGWSGVFVNLTTEAHEGVAGQTAVGNGTDEVQEIESVIGSPFDDRVVANTERTDVLYGGMGSDSCSGGCEEPATNLTAPYAYVDRTNPIAIESTLPDPTLIVVGGSASEALTMSRSGATVTLVASVGGAPETLAVGNACSATGTPGTYTCSLGLSAPTTGGTLWVGGAGDDTLTDNTAAANGMTTDLDGATGNDTITGSSGSETIYSGNSGNDVMHGGNGGDALLALGTGGDLLYGEEGNDQLVTSDPCEGHVFRGGGPNDQDVAGFARTATGVEATLGDPDGDPSTVGSSWYGAAYKRTAEDPNSCVGDTRSWIGADNEILEGTDVADRLTGNQNDNTFWARRGADIVIGANGNDILEGHDGNDQLDAGAGDDVIRGQNDVDTVFGRAGVDTVFGGPGADTVHGEEGADDLEGEGENDTLFGDDGNDRLSGGANADTLYGGNGLDVLFGDDGADWLYGQAENDKLRARDGIRDNAVNCGEQTDEPVEADTFDPVVNCE